MIVKLANERQQPHAVAAGQLASPKRVLTWVYFGRLAVAVVFPLLLATDARFAPETLLYVVGLVVAAVVFTAGSYYVTHLKRRPPAAVFLHAQVLYDALFLTAVVYLTGGQLSFFAPLFVLVITVGALLLPIAGGMALGLLASFLYFTAAVSSAGAVYPGMLLQTALFAMVALVTAYLGERVRRARVELGEVQTELRLLRLDTDDILQTIMTGILTVDGNGCLVYLNPAAAEMLSLETGEWLDRPILERLDQVAPGLGRVIERTARTRAPIRRFETERLAEDSFILGVSTTPLERIGEERPPVTAIFQDITEKKRVENLRRRAEKLEAVAELSASLAHEIKNPLASIRSAVEQIAGGRIDPEDTRLLGGLIVRESDRLSRLLGEFIDFARVKVTAPQPVDFVELVRGVVDVVNAHPDTRENGITLIFEIPPSSVLIRGAEDLLHRAVLNLVLNASQWAGKGGRVELALDQVQSDLLSPALGAFRLVRLEVRDTGPGVPEEIREQIFNPFFTRRPGGTGLGLALVQRAVEAHGGAIFVDSGPGGAGGAVFSLYLPTVAADVGVEPYAPFTRATTRP